MLAKLGLDPAPPADRTAACGRLSDEQRTCLLTLTSWIGCKVQPPFVLYDGTRAHDALLGKPVTPDESRTRIAALAGTWRHEGTQTILWTIAGDGALTATRDGKAEPPHQLSFARERLLAIKTGAATQYVPVFIDGDQLFMSWTSGAIATPIRDDKSFVLDLADQRFIFWTAPQCALVDPHYGTQNATCAWQAAGSGRAFIVHGDRELVFQERAGALVHPAMERYDRYGK